ncbi:hypothetical protein OXX80_010271 [Metschnikowia pulcherrima]
MTEVAYGVHPLQKLKVFHHSPENTQTLLLIHGGAWNDPGNTYNDFMQMADSLMRKRVSVNVIGINYRLTPEIVHPFHLQDLVDGIEFLAREYNVFRISVLGHSVGATMALQLLNYKQILEAGYEHLQEKVDFSIPDLKIELDTIFFIDGIYDIADLVAEYGPPYQAFVDRAFVSRKQYAEAVQPSRAKFTNFAFSPKKIIVVQSSQDELLSLRQTHKFMAFLQSLGVPYSSHEEDWGAHEEVYRREELANLVSETLKQIDA